MASIVLESALGSQYEDAPDSYEFPTRYLRHFEAVGKGEPLFAVIYEPRGETGTGRMGYVALAEVVTSPSPTGRRNNAGEELWRVSYRRPAEPFGSAVPREVLGEAVETWLRALPRGRPRNVATFGRAVRALTDEDFERILRLAEVNPLIEEASYPIDPFEPLTDVRERVERIIKVYERRAAFRREVLGAYGFVCAVTGLGLGGIAPTKSLGILDAAHVRPVGSAGVDSIRNGIAMTPTLHRLFDFGLFTLEPAGDDLRVLVSPRLETRMVEVPERGVSLGLNAGTALLLPANPALRPRKSDVDFHRNRVFLSA
jgi:putative restriction endonuclease